MGVGESLFCLDGEQQEGGGPEGKSYTALQKKDHTKDNTNYQRGKRHFPSPLFCLMLHPVFDRGGRGPTFFWSFNTGSGCLSTVEHT